MVAIEDWYSENPNVVIMTNLDDIGQPYSCEQWGERHQDFNADVFPLMIDDGTQDEIWPWFHSGGYPSAVFIDHNMNVFFKMIGVSLGPATSTIDSMIDACGDLCTLDPPQALFDFEIDKGCISGFKQNKKVDSLKSDDSIIFEPPIRRLNIITTFLKDLITIFFLI